MVSDFIFFGIAFVIGALVGAFTLGQILLVSGVGLPLAVRLKNQGILLSSAPITKYIISLFVLLIGLLIFIALVGFFFPHQLTAFLFGVGVTYFPAFSQRNLNTNNLDDFIRVNARYFSGELVTISEDDFQQALNIKDVASMQANEVFTKVFGDAIGNIIFYCIVTVVILILGNLWWWLGAVPAVLFAVFMLICFLQFLFNVVINIISWVLFIYAKIKKECFPISEQLWTTGALLVQTFEQLIDIFYLLLLYQAYGSGLISLFKT